MKKMICLFLMLLFALSLMPAFSEEQPGEGDISQEVAVETALAFFEETFGFSRQEWPAEVKETRFHPGLLHDGLTTVNCWFVVLKNEMPMNAVAQIHGKTGEIVCWGCDGEGNLTDFYEDIPRIIYQHFYHAMPESKEWLNAKAFYQRALADFAYHSDVSMGTLATSSELGVSYGNTSYAGFLPDVERENEPAIEFSFVADVPAPSRVDNSEFSDPMDRWTYTVAYSMSDGETLAQELTLNYEPKALHMNPLK